MTPSPACFDLVRRFEGLKLHAYPDPGSGGEPWTVGWGATGADIGPTTVWTQEQADERLHADLGAFGHAVSLLLGHAPTTQHQLDALTSFAFNLGTPALATSTLLRMHLAGNFDGAANQFQFWIHAGGRVMPGLITRRSSEATLYRTP